MTAETLLTLAKTVLGTVLECFTDVFAWAIANPVVSIFVALAVLSTIVILGFSIYNSARH